MKYLLAIVTLLGPTHTTATQAQIIWQMPTKKQDQKQVLQEPNCELTFAGCKLVPGEVNRYSYYWKFEPILNPNPGWPGVLKPSTDPASCMKAVGDNLTSLTKYYGMQPEITVPNQEIISRVDKLLVPTIKPLFGSQGSKAAEPDDLGKPFADRISSALKRVQALSDKGTAFATTMERTKTWEAATLAATALVAKSDAIESALAFERKWPTLEEFAPGVWKLEICSSLKPDLVAELQQRLKREDPGSVWGFAFHDDWLTLGHPFQPPYVTLSPTDRFTLLATPFFVEPRDITAQRKDKTLFALADVKKFRAAVAQKGTELTHYVADRKAQQVAHLTGLRQRFDIERSIIDGLHAAFHVQLKDMADVKAKIQKTAQEKQEIFGKVAKAKSEVTTADSPRVQLTQERDQARSHYDAAATDVQTAYDLVTKAVQALEAVGLGCGGATYQDCKDNEAKLDYDHRLYNANLAVTTAKQIYSQTLDRLTLAANDLLAKETAYHQQQVVVSDLRKQIGALLKKEAELTANLDDSLGEAKKREADMAPIAHLLETVAKVVEAMEAQLVGVDPTFATPAAK